MLSRYFKVVDLFFEVVDARCPVSSRSREIKRLVRGKKSVLILNKADLADPAATKRWVGFLSEKGEEVLAVDSLRGKGLRMVRELLQSEAEDLKRRLWEKERRGRPLRVAALGIPNTGKSSFLNQIVGRRAAATGNRPGVTRGPQWVHLHNVISVLDTPGVLPPSVRDEEDVFKLALIGALKLEDRDPELIAGRLLEFLKDHYPTAVCRSFGASEDMLSDLECIARSKNFLLPDGRLDLQRTAVFLVNALRSGKLGRITLEFPW